MSDPTRRTTEPGCSMCACPAIPEGVRAVVFDFDGTLGDTALSHERALRAALQDYGFDLDPGWYRQHIGLSIHDLLGQLPGAGQLPHDEIVQRSRTRLLASMDTITAIGCVVSLLHTARDAGLPCAVASGASTSLVQPGIAALGLSEQFAAIVTREDAAHGKPAPDLYAEAARRLQLPPDRCLAVDDAPEGLASARAAGMAHLRTLVHDHLAAVHDDEHTHGRLEAATGPPAPGSSRPRGAG